MAFNKRDIEFLYEVGSLRNVERSWRQLLGMRCANDLEHTVRVIWLALILARREGVRDEQKVMKMALAHDIAETRTLDANWVHKAYVKADEEGATRDVFKGTSLLDFDREVLGEYRRWRSLAAKVVKDADTLDVDLELRELGELGLRSSRERRVARRRVRDELFTKSAKALWDALDGVEVADWWRSKLGERKAG